MADDRIRRYRFGPLERRGVIGGLRPGQVAIGGGALVLAVILLNTSRSPAIVLVAFAVALAGAAVAFLPFHGRTAEEWAPVAAGWVLKRVGGQTRWRSRAPQTGAHAKIDAPVAEPPLDLPPEVGRVDLLSAPLHGEQVGVLKDRKGPTFTAVLAVRVRSFGLLDRAEQERRLAGWGAVLAGLARENSPVRRLQWLERTVPSDGDEVARYLQEERDATVPLASSSVGTPREDPEADDLVALLRRISEEFDELWGHHEVASRSGTWKRFLHPLVGTITLDCQILNAERTSPNASWSSCPRLGDADATQKLELLAVVGSQRF